MGNKKYLKRYSDTIPSYKDYIEIQKTKFCSFESNYERCVEGQRRYIRRNFLNIDKNAYILDIACGDGTGLKIFKEMGFINMVGVELNPQKVVLAKSFGFPVYESDMHDLRNLNDSMFDIIYSSHTLEHAYYPIKVIQELTRALKTKGFLYIVLPYPDRGNKKAHGGKFELGTNILDGGKTVCNFFVDKGYVLCRKSFDSFRQKEIWLKLQKK